MQTSNNIYKDFEAQVLVFSVLKIESVSMRFVNQAQQTASALIHLDPIAILTATCVQRPPA